MLVYSPEPRDDAFKVGYYAAADNYDDDAADAAAAATAPAYDEDED